MDLILGSAQFGMPYGIANNFEQVKTPEIEKIIKFSVKNNIKYIDTAISYGNVEAILSTIDLKNFNIINKIPTYEKNYGNIRNWAKLTVNNSLEKMKLKKFDSLLIHNIENIDNKNFKKLILTFEEMKKNKIINKLGISVYNNDQLKKIFNIYNIDIVQLPYSIFNRSFEKNGWLEKLKKNKIEIHGRSIFLQGLLLVKAKNLPRKFLVWEKLWSKYNIWLDDHKLSALEACIEFIKNSKYIDKVVVGVNSLNQLKEINNCFKSPKRIIEFPFFTNNKKIYDPNEWYK